MTGKRLSMKILQKNNAAKPVEKTAPLCILVISLAFILAGIFRGEAECVIEKATKICMECIGIG